MKITLIIFWATILVSLTYSCNKDKSGLADIPSLTTIVANDISSTTATSGGNVLNDGGSDIISRGVCWGTSFNPTVENNKTMDGSGAGKFTSSIYQLEQNTYYYLRAYAINSSGVAYGNQISFTTLSGTKPGTVSDVEGNIYDTVVIGTQTWMRENLKTTQYNNGSAIPIVAGNDEWYNLTSPGYCWYNNDLNNKTDYGALYNWYTLNQSSNGNKNLCPSGWHVPTDDDWMVLTTYLGGEKYAGGKLKETGTIHWLEPNEGATNETGFTALPGGCRDYDGTFHIIGSFGFWWSSTEFVGGGAWSRYIAYSSVGVFSLGRFEQDGFSVRCIEDKKADIK